MKKILTLLLVTSILLFTSACDGQKNEQNDEAEVTNIISYQKIDTISVAEAIKLFKKDPNTEIKGYNLSDSGWLTRYDKGSIGNIHTINLDHSSPITYLESSHSCAYGLKDNVLTKYSFGEILGSTPIPAGSIYCGISERNGFIFRDKSKVFCINLDLSETKTIATDVKLVLDVEYEYSDDATAQPLLLMKDGSIKVYVQWESELMPPIFEGGYGGTYIEN